MSFDEMLYEAVETYFSEDSGDNFTSEKPSHSPCINGEVDYALVSDDYQAFFYELNGEKIVRVEFQTDKPAQTLEYIKQEAGFEQETRWRIEHPDERVMASTSTRPEEAIIEISEETENPERYLEPVSG
jgi:hypothetical protein